MVISVASGKGGTGKTTICVNLALSLPNVQLVDCDVEEPNDHIFIKPRIKSKIPVYIPIPRVDESKCDFCGRCQNVCAYNAIAVLKNKVLIFPELCHGCGACALLCPKGAIEEVKKEVGFVEVGEKGKLQFAHGILNVGEVMAPPVIRAVKKFINPTRTVIIDAPPGTSCPVIESVKNSHFCVLVTEPTPFGLNDLKLAVEVVRKLKIPFGVVINRADLGNKKTEDYCKKENIPILMRIPFKKEIAKIYSTGGIIVLALPEYKKDFQEMFNKISKICRI